jgi:orotidine-5'-phosphate decarboxylase
MVNPAALILALDVKDIKEARYFLDKLYPKVKIFKIGAVLFTAYGPKIIEIIREKGAEVFLDLKYHDIPSTVAKAARQAVRLKVKMLTLHTVGGEEMLRASVSAAKEEARRIKIKKSLLLGVTVLTSDKSRTNTIKTVLVRARLAQRAGLDGVVCSVHEAVAVRKTCGRNFIIVTPGIRSKGTEQGDQKRVATANQAMKAGANFIVVGRPILEADNPLRAAEEILKDLL